MSWEWGTETAWGQQDGVDKQDQVIQPYDCTRKTMTWTKKLFFHFLQVSACNAFILACKDGYKKPFLQFLGSAIFSWLWKEKGPPELGEPKDIVWLFLLQFPLLQGRSAPPACVQSVQRKAGRGRRFATTALTARQHLPSATLTALEPTTPN